MTRSIYVVVVLAGLGALGCGIGDAQTQLRSAIDAKQGELDQCYAEALGRDRSATGEMHLWVHVEDAAGRVDDVEVDQSDVNDEALQTCVSGVLTGIQLDKAPAANLRVEYTVRLQPRP